MILAMIHRQNDSAIRVIFDHQAYVAQKTVSGSQSISFFIEASLYGLPDRHLRVVAIAGSSPERGTRLQGACDA
jgi:hypothetical protein